MRFKYCRAAAVAMLVAIAAPLAAQDAGPKIDKALTQSLNAGCGTEQVIIRTKPGFRAGLSLSLKAHGDRVTAEHSGIEAVTAEMHCDDMATLAAFPEVLSISQDAIVNAHGISAPDNARTSRSRARGRQRSSIERPTRNQHSTSRDDDDDDEDRGRVNDRTSAGRPSKSEKAEHDKANSSQQALFDTLGVNGRQRPSRTPGGVMLGDVVVDNSSAGDRDDYDHHGNGFQATGVAIIDSGIQPSWDFGNRITHFYDFTSGRAVRAKPSDPYGHGTHVAGLIGGAFVGVAPEVRLVGLRVLNAYGQGRTSHVIKAIEYATANRARLGIRAINLSLGHPIYESAATDPLVQAVEHAVRAGLVVITTSGNVGINPATGEPGYTGILSPGNAPSALTVGAVNTAATRTRTDDRVTPYSSRGPSWYDAFPKPDVVAPGHNMLSVAAATSKLRKDHEKRGGWGNYMRLSGTSMAAGVTSGVVALMLQVNPHLTPNAVKMILEFTAIPVNDANGEPFDALTQGAGSVNASGAIRLALAIDATQPIGSKWLTVGMPFESTIGYQTYAWSQKMIWGAHRVIGNGVVDENRLAWANHIVWGEGTEDDNIVWGTGEDDNIVWGTAFDEGDNIVWGTNFIWSDAFDSEITWGAFYEDDNIVWGTSLVWGNRMVGIFEGDNIVWGTRDESDNIVWGTLTFRNIVWGTFYQDADNIVWGTFRFGEDDNIVWGTLRFGEEDNIVWGTLRFGEGDNIVWGTMKFGEADNIVWGTLRFSEADNIVWGTARAFDESDNIVWGTGVIVGDLVGGLTSTISGRR
jgi:serine protease AprX